jgi:hypothetical protein
VPIPYYNESEITTVRLYNTDSGAWSLLYTLVAPEEPPVTIAGKVALDYITFTESMLSPIITGELVFDITGGDFERLQLVGNEKLEIVANTPDGVAKAFPFFNVHSFEETTNLADTDKTPESLIERKITLHFSTDKAKEIFEKERAFPEGFIGKISSRGEVGESDPQLGLLEELELSYFNEVIDTEPTLNEIWIHPSTMSLPTRKFARNMNILQLINYCKEFAVSLLDTTSVNYFFWHDLDGWHFKSASLLIREGVEQGEQLKTFTLTENVLDPNRIISLDVISDVSEYSMTSSGALYSYYYKVRPDYTSPYARLMDDREKYTSKKITYNYKTDAIGPDPSDPNWIRIESGELVPHLTETQISELENDSLRLYDRVFGWHDTRSYGDNQSGTTLLLTGNSIPIELEAGRDEESDIDPNYDIVDHVGYDSVIWQEMFDSTTLPSDILKKIVYDIKAPTFQAKKLYRDTLAYKEKWNIYRNSVCCEDNTLPEEGITAIIKGAAKIGTNMYRYAWREVEIIPKAEIGNFLGAAISSGTTDPIPDDVGYYNATVPRLNQMSFISPIENGDVFPAEFQFFREGVLIEEFTEVGDLSGEIVVKLPDTCFADDHGTITNICPFTYRNESTEAIEKYFTQGLAGLTLTFHNDRYSPWLIVEKPGAAGADVIMHTTSNDGDEEIPIRSWKLAYNMNEMLNRNIYDENKYKQGPVSKTTTFYQGEKPTSSSSGDWGMPPYDDIDPEDVRDIPVGPGVNATSDIYGDYPSAFSMLPIGHYKKIERDSVGEDPDADREYKKGLACDPIPIGHIVTIKSLSHDDILSCGIDNRIVLDENEEPVDVNKVIFYFNVENAHDGNCIGECP